jgi:hypothetical protein
MLKRVLRWMARVVAVLVVAFLVGFLVARQNPHAPVTTEEVIPPGEADAIMRMTRRATQDIVELAGPDKPVRRDVHAKPHGCVTAEFRVNDSLDPIYRWGVLSEPGRTFKAWVRFSNGTLDDDTWGDARGMGVKLMGVAGRKIMSGTGTPLTQDFVMINYHSFFARDVLEYEQFFYHQADGNPLGFFFNGWNPLKWHLHNFYNAAHMKYQRIATPLDMQYYSMSAFRLGAHNMKFSAKPCKPLNQKRPSHPGPNYLREALVKNLRDASVCFDFLVQLQDPSKNMPIEDSSVEWSQEESPYRPVARITIPRQEFDTDAQNSFCEALSFTPWHSLHEHHPLGGINRCRRAVYQEVANRRRYRNDAPTAEPLGWCLDLTGADCPPDKEVRPLANAGEAGT